MSDRIVELSEALDRAPGDVALLFSRGRAYAASDLLAEALADFTSVLALDPGHKQAAMGRGRILNRMGQFEAAVDDYTTALSSPARPGAQHSPTPAAAPPRRTSTASDGMQARQRDEAQGLRERRAGQHSRAVSEYTAAIAVDPDSFEAHYNRGLAYHRLADFRAAITDFRRAVALNPRSAHAQYNLGIAYEQDGQHAEAIESFTAAIAIEGPTPNPDFMHNRVREAPFLCCLCTCTYASRPQGYSLRQAGRCKEAIADYSACIDLAPEHFRAWSNRGAAWQCLGDHDRAVADYTAAIRLQPAHSASHHSRGVSREHLDQWEDAISDLHSALSE